MTTSSAVREVKSATETVFTNIQSTISNIGNSWQGASKVSIITQIETYINEHKEKISSQLDSLAIAIDLYDQYKIAKENYQAAEREHNNAVRDDNQDLANTCLKEMHKQQQEMDRLASKIESLLNDINGMLLEGAETGAGAVNNSFASGNGYVPDYPVDEYGIVIKNDGVPRSGTAAEKMAYLFPDGTPNSSKEMSKYLTETYVDYIDENGERKQAKIRVHKALEEDIQEIFSEIADTGFKMKPSNYGDGAYIESYAWREKRSGSGRSQHSYATAVDINVEDNPRQRNSREGTSVDPAVNEYAITEDVANIFRSYGWSWGGSDWSYPESQYDYMHFDFAESGPRKQK